MPEIPSWAKEQREEKKREAERLKQEDMPLEQQIDPDAGEITQFLGYQSPDSALGVPGALWDYIAGNIGTEAALAFEPSAKAQEGILRERLPEDYRVEYSPEYDATIVRDPEGQTGFVNRPGMSQRDFTNFGALASLFTPAGKLFSAGRSPAHGAALTSGGAALTEAGRQAWSRLMGSEANEENLIRGMNLPEIATAGATQFLPDWLMGRATVGKYMPGAPPDLANRIAGNQQALETAGLQALRGQTGADVVAEVEDLRTLSQLPETSPAISDAFQQQNIQAEDAVGRLIQSIEEGSTPPEMRLGGTETGRLSPGDQFGQDPAERFKSATEQLRGGLVEVRKRETNKLYEEATGSPAPVDTNELNAKLTTIINETAPGSSANRALERARSMIGGGGDVTMVEGVEVLAETDPRTLSQLHDAKTEIDTMIQKAVEDGNQAMVMRLERAQDDLIEHIQATSPLYKEARETFASLSGPIDEFDQSILGTVARMDPQNAYRLGELIFNPRVPNRTRALIQQRIGMVDPNAFRLLAGDVLRTRLSRISDVGPGEVENVPYKINQALFKNQQERDMWKQAFPEKAEEIDALSRGLQIVSRGRHAGSPTATRQQVIRERGYESSLPATAAEAAADLMRWLTVFPKAAEGVLGGARQNFQTRARMRGLERQQEYTPSDVAGEYVSEQGQPVGWITAALQAAEGMTDE